VSCPLRFAPTSIDVDGQAVSFLPKTDLLQYRNTYYWDKKMWKTGPGDHSKAQLTNWLALSGDKITGVPGSTKNPLEGRVWYNYPGQTSSHAPGDMNTPSKIVRAVETPSGLEWTMTQNFYDNATGRLIRTVDPIGRETILTYDTNGIDLVEVKQKNSSGGYDILLQASYPTPHLPSTITYANGSTSSFSWNGRGQLISTTNALGETTVLTYDPDGYLTQIDPPLPGTSDVVTFTYDSYRRLQTETQWGYTTQYEYDLLDRVTRVTYPDGTTEEIVYQDMHAAFVKDREDRWTERQVDAVQQLVGVVDPAGRHTRIEWCYCGAPSKLIDADGRVTEWVYDIQGRVVEKRNADGSSAEYEYHPYSGWLELASDAENQEKSYAYAKDGRVLSVEYLREDNPTPDVSFTWDAFYPRMATMTDGTGTTAYTFGPAGSPGALMKATVDGPLADDLIAFTYDELDRLVQRTIDGIPSSVTYDELGRVAGLANPLGTFTPAFDPTSSLPMSVSNPVGLTVEMTRYDANGEYRMATLAHKWAGAPLAQYGYEYDELGNVTRQDIDHGEQRVFDYSYDPVDRLTGADVFDPVTGTQIDTIVYEYDKSDNRVLEQREGRVTSAFHNSVNELWQLDSGGKALFSGELGKNKGQVHCHSAATASRPE